MSAAAPASDLASALATLATAAVDPSDAGRALGILVEAGAARSILVVGVDIGAVSIAVPLAAALARTGRRTVLVDADLSRHRPRLSTTHDGGTETAGPSTEAAAPQPPPVVATAVPNLSLLPAGRGAGAGGDPLDGPRLDALIPALLADADRVVVLAPPLAVAADALALARHVDTIVLVVTLGRTTRAAAIRARDLLQAAGGSLLGTVLADG